MKKRFTEEQIIGILKEAEAGAKVAELCRKYGISDATYYNWKAKFGGMTVSDAQRLKAMEASGEMAREQEAFKQRVIENTLRPKPVDGLTLAQENFKEIRFKFTSEF